MYAEHMSPGEAPSGKGAVVPRSTISGLVAKRDAALKRVVEAYDQLHQALGEAEQAGGSAWPGLGSELSDLLLRRGERDAFVDGCRRRIDAAAWNNVIYAHGFERVMDRQAMAECRGQLERDPPVFDVETVDGTMLQLLLDADKLMRRGVANAFAGLDRRFRSHDGFKIGTRVVLDAAITESGQWNHHRRQDDTIRDVERTLMRLDGQEVKDRYAGVVGLIDTERGRHFGRFTCEVATDLLRVKVFKNGNVHLWFLRDDLVRLVNRTLAEHYGEVLGQGSDAVADDPLANPTTAVVRNMGWFPTPEAVARTVASEANVDWVRPPAGQSRTVLRVLEPSAGEGALVSALQESANGSVDLRFVAVELHPGRAASLRAAGIDARNGHQTIERDFLSVSPDETGLFDRIVMNPPFDRANDVAHVVHAARFLAPHGRLVAVMASSVEFRDDRRSIAFREMVEASGGRIRDLPLGSFESSGTMVSTCLVIMNGPSA